MESILIENKILQNSTGYQTNMLWNPYQQQTRSYKILRDTRQKCYGIHINSKQDPTRFYGILDKHAMESILIANKMLQDSTEYQTKMLWNPYQQQTRSYKILKDPARTYKILQDSTGYQTKMLWNPYQQQTRSYKILQDPTRFYGILDKNALESISIANKILQDSARSYKILQDSTGYQTKMLWNPY